MKLFKKFSTVSLIMLLFLSIAMFTTLTSFAQEPVTMVLASMLPGEDHVYNRTLKYFAEKVDEYYDGPVNFEFHFAADLGTEKDLFELLFHLHGWQLGTRELPLWMHLSYSKIKLPGKKE